MRIHQALSSLADFLSVVLIASVWLVPSLFVLFLVAHPLLGFWLINQLIHDILERDMLISRVLHGCGTNNAALSLLSHHVRNIPDALVIKLQVAEVWLADVEGDSEQLEDGCLLFALGERLHGRVHQIELLLQIVEADLRIDAIPVQGSCLVRVGRHKSAIDVLLVQNVEKGLV